MPQPVVVFIAVVR